MLQIVSFVKLLTLRRKKAVKGCTLPQNRVFAGIQSERTANNSEKHFLITTLTLGLHILEDCCQVTSVYVCVQKPLNVNQSLQLTEIIFNHN